MYTREQVLEACKEYFEGDELAPDVFMKYALRDADDNILEADPDQMHRRLAREFARIEAKHPNPMSEETIYDLFKGFGKVVPQGSPMSGVGNPYQLQSLSNCFVVEQPHDSYAGIMYTDQEQVGRTRLASNNKRRRSHDRYGNEEEEHQPRNRRY